MSLLAKLFGGGKTIENIPSPGDAIQRLLEVEEMLIKKQEYLEKKVQGELLIVKKNGTKNKRVALQALKRKKKYEMQLTQIDGTLTTIEYQRDALENASTNTEVLKVMRHSAKALQKEHGSMNIDEVHDVIDDIQEQQQISQEISEAISSPLGYAKDLDDDDILKELDELMEDEVLDKIMEIPGTVDLPNVPVPATKGREKVETDDDDLKELAAWAS